MRALNTSIRFGRPPLLFCSLSLPPHPIKRSLVENIAQRPTLQHSFHEAGGLPDFHKRFYMRPCFCSPFHVHRWDEPRIKIRSIFSANKNSLDTQKAHALVFEKCEDSCLLQVMSDDLK